MKYYKELVNCKEIIQKCVSIYETCECDIGALDIHRFSRVDGLSTRPLGLGVSHNLFKVNITTRKSQLCKGFFFVANSLQTHKNSLQISFSNVFATKQFCCKNPY